MQLAQVKTSPGIRKWIYEAITVNAMFPSNLARTDLSNSISKSVVRVCDINQNVGRRCRYGYSALNSETTLSHKATGRLPCASQTAAPRGVEIPAWPKTAPRARAAGANPGARKQWGDAGRSAEVSKSHLEASRGEQIMMVGTRHGRRGQIKDENGDPVVERVGSLGTTSRHWDMLIRSISSASLIDSRK